MLLLVKALKVMYVGVPSGGIISSIIPLAFKVAYYSFIRVQEVYTTNVQI